MIVDTKNRISHQVQQKKKGTTDHYEILDNWGSVGHAYADRR